MSKPQDLPALLLRLSGHMAAALALVLSPAVVQAAHAPIADSGFVYTANEFGNSVSRIELSTGDVLTLPVSISPHNVQVTADGGTLLVAGTELGGEGHDGGMADMEGMAEGRGLLLVFDTADFGAGPVTEIEVGEHPAHVIADRDGRRAFVANSEDGNVSVVDLVAGVVTGVISTGAFPHGLRQSPVSSEIYVADVEDDSVSVLDPDEMSEVARIPVGDAPVQVGFIPDGSLAFVSLRDEDKVAIIDTATRSVIGTVAVGDGPIQVFATPDADSVFVANQGTEAAPANTVSVLDVATGTVTDTIEVGRGAHGVAVSADGKLAFVTNIYEGTVSVISTAEGKVVATVPVGAGPNGVTFAD